jgi:hypothetical protein
MRALRTITVVPPLLFLAWYVPKFRGGGWPCVPGSLADVVLEAGIVLTLGAAVVALALAIRYVVAGTGLVIWAFAVAASPVLYVASLSVFGLECAR